MTPSPLPFAPGAVRQFLLSKPEFTDLVPGTVVSTRHLPDPLQGPFVTLAAPGNVGVDPMLRKPMVQINAWTPKIEILGGTVDPEELSWNIAAMAGQLVGRAHNIAFRGSAWSGRWVDGPITMVDTQRGIDFPLFRAVVRVELKMRAPRH
ncbi:hypothetical protein [Prescottella equi]|uniref:hypothetical protein n=1 Tax=Rhodococcus hoagii TaxID=43767 RepID=UPI000A101D31|nr:hypothetical protein [Prescottella equi]ORJ99871.1 hypothetical protein A6F58_00755 [Prescottella equi]